MIPSPSAHDSERNTQHKGIVIWWRESRSGELLEVQFHTRPQLWAPELHRLPGASVSRQDSIVVIGTGVRAFVRRVLPIKLLC